MFAFGDKVELEGTNTEGTVVGRVEYLDGDTQYFVRYVNWQGELTKSWYTASDLILLKDEYEDDSDDDSDDDDSDDDDSDDDSDDDEDDDEDDDDSDEDDHSGKARYYWE